MCENSTKIAVILADGFEEIEAITLIDILRRAGANVKIVGLSAKNIRGAHGIKIEADEIFDDVFSRENINENIDACAKPLNSVRDLNQDTKEQILEANSPKSTSGCSVKQTPNLDENLIDDFDAILLPGGLPGAKFLAQSKKLGAVLRRNLVRKVKRLARFALRRGLLLVLEFCAGNLFVILGLKSRF